MLLLSSHLVKAYLTHSKLLLSLRLSLSVYRFSLGLEHEELPPAESSPHATLMSKLSDSRMRTLVVEPENNCFNNTAWCERIFAALEEIAHLGEDSTATCTSTTTSTSTSTSTTSSSAGAHKGRHRKRNKKQSLTATLAMLDSSLDALAQTEGSDSKPKQLNKQAKDNKRTADRAALSGQPRQDSTTSAIAELLASVEIAEQTPLERRHSLLDFTSVTSASNGLRDPPRAAARLTSSNSELALNYQEALDLLARAHSPTLVPTPRSLRPPTAETPAVNGTKTHDDDDSHARDQPESTIVPVESYVDTLAPSELQELMLRIDTAIGAAAATTTTTATDAASNLESPKSPNSLSPPSSAERDLSSARSRLVNPKDTRASRGPGIGSAIVHGSVPMVQTRSRTNSSADTEQPSLDESPSNGSPRTEHKGIKPSDRKKLTRLGTTPTTTIADMLSPLGAGSSSPRSPRVARAHSSAIHSSPRMVGDESTPMPWSQSDASVSLSQNGLPLHSLSSSESASMISSSSSPAVPLHQSQGSCTPSPCTSSSNGLSISDSVVSSKSASAFEQSLADEYSQMMALDAEIRSLV